MSNSIQSCRVCTDLANLPEVISRGIPEQPFRLREEYLAKEELVFCSKARSELCELVEVLAAIIVNSGIRSELLFSQSYQIIAKKNLEVLELLNQLFGIVKYEVLGSLELPPDENPTPANVKQAFAAAEEFWKTKPS